MKILGIHRVEFLMADPAAGAKWLGEGLGFEMSQLDTDAHGVTSFFDFDAGLELAGPSRSDSPLQALLDRKGEGFLTVVFRVDSVAEVVAWAEAKGIEVLVDLEGLEGTDRYSSYRQVSLDSATFPAGMSFTFAEYVER
jgi:catechol 2,3-dioxygenase-like lactoylglutathione lyase family enzyme